MAELIITEKANIVAIADSIRNKTNNTSGMTLDEMAQGISDVYDIAYAAGQADGGIDTSDATATSSDILNGKTAYVDGEKVTGVIETKSASDLSASGAIVTVPSGYYASQAKKSVGTTTQAIPSISVNSSGLITASATQSAGYVSAGTKSATKQLTTQGTKTITPSTSSQTAVVSGVYTTGVVTVTGDANLKAENIAEGVSIFGVEGSHTGGIDTSDATASADDILSGKTAYANGSKITGTIPTMAGATIIPTTSERTAVMSGVYTTGEVKVAAIPSSYIQPSGSIEITENGTHDVANYASAVVNVASSGGGLQIATGTFTPSSGVFNGKTISVTGLGFEPSFVCIQLSYSSSNITLKNRNVLIGSYFKQDEQKHFYMTIPYSNVAQALIGNDSATITVNADGFSLSGKSSSYSIATSLYSYVAIR